jgi:hypothetical protein
VSFGAQECSPVAASPDVSVVIPLNDARGDATDHLRTWTHGQTHPRSRYEVVIVSDGEEPDVDREIAALLQPHDRFEVAAGALLIELWNRAAELASSDWLLFTENHVHARPDCLEKALAGIEADPDLEAASIEHGHITPAPIGELGARWFDEVYEEWFRPEQWMRLNLAGFVIRRDVHGAVGGHDHRYGLFAAPLLSARLDERGSRVGHLPDAEILHIQCDEIEEHHGHSADYVIGECEARTTLPPVFAEHYFGYRPLIWNRRAMETRSARHSAGWSMTGAPSPRASSCGTPAWRNYAPPAPRRWRRSRPPFRRMRRCWNTPSSAPANSTASSGSRHRRRRRRRPLPASPRRRRRSRLGRTRSRFSW